MDQIDTSPGQGLVVRRWSAATWTGVTVQWQAVAR